ncbi:hypothetical protein [Alteribacillus bidgolensis]|uniref:Methyl-accepting chemotaxis protein n=1 Tax=Alteribacillus bidgolensis TaxID=930129 RepID=A0A1G8IIA6_9BACI|nr:hypothetical protein [Alteribacillus bidgolensis]SDI18260.1 hypothetical protein SAMN05216352_105195 [Alteribacillus bidgolensis]
MPFRNDSADVIAEGVTIVQQAGDSIRKLYDSAANTRTAVQDNMKIADKLMTNGEEVSGIMADINKIAEEFTDTVTQNVSSMEQQVAGVQQITSDAAKLSQEANQLNKIVSRFHLDKEE